MTSFTFEYILGNLPFVCLFTMVIWYWVKIIFSLSPALQIVGTIGMVATNLSLTGLLAWRWHTSGHFPLSNLFESLLFLSWGLTAFHLVLERVSRSDVIGVVTSPMAFLTTAFASFTLPHEMQETTALIPALQSNWLMMHVTIMMLSYVALIVGSLLSIAFLVIHHLERRKLKIASTSHMAASSEGPFPAEQVPCAKADMARGVQSQGVFNARIEHQEGLSPYGAAYQGDVGSLPQPCGTPPSRGVDPMPWGMIAPPQQGLLASCQLAVLPTLPEFSEADLQKRTNGNEPASLSPLAQAVDNLSYRTLGLGFPLLTIGILSGAVWANEAWGSYWSWDPKETWAFITWLVFAIYLHARLGRGWRGTKPATIAAAGFFVVWICYLGVNLLGTGLHSYGWLRNIG